MEYIPIKITLKDQVTGEIIFRDATYVKDFLEEFIQKLDQQNEANIGNQDCYLVYRISSVADDIIYYQWDEDWILDVEEYFGKGTIPERIAATRLIKRPSDYSYIAQTVMSNYNYIINKKIAAKLKKEKLYADYVGGTFLGSVWWNKQDQQWFCEIWQNQKHIQTFFAESLPELMLDVTEKYG
jgi:hypothetical protein